MNEEQRKEFSLLEDDWLNLSFNDGEWKTILASAEEYINKNINKKLAETMLTEIKAVLYTLVHDGNAYEDVVIETALLYLLVKKAVLSFENLEGVYPDFITKAVAVLLDYKSPNYLKNIFKSVDYPYLNKIKLSELIVKIKNLSESGEKEKLIEKIDEAKKIVKSFDGITHKGLMGDLKSLI